MTIRWEQTITCSALSDPQTPHNQWAFPQGKALCVCLWFYLFVKSCSPFGLSRSSSLTLPAGANVGSYKPHSVLRLLPKSLQVRASLFSATQVPLRIATASVVGAIDCALRLHYAFRRHPSCVGGWLAPFRLRLQTIFDGYTLANTDTSVCDYGVATHPFRCQPDTSACFSDP